MDDFLRNLEKSNLLTAAQWTVVRCQLIATGDGPTVVPGITPTNSEGSVATPRGLAAALVERGFMTRWQADMLLVGKKAFFLGKYRLLDHIGTGGMGAVFKALHGEMGRTVAIKILSAEVMKKQQAVARFLYEIQAVAALDDPHIVAAYDAGSERGVHYLVMEYVDGHDLGYLIKHNSPLPIGWACECIRQAALGLAHAHEQGLVHRDIKPTNLLVTKDAEGRPLTKILDLGLARFVTEMVPPELAEPVSENEDGSLTQIGQFLGTPDYISPEQAQDTRLADIRSDIFSLGCTLFRLLTGELPFAGTTVQEKLAAREKTKALSARSLRGEVPVALDAVVARMLARNPSDRYQAPREVAKALVPFTDRNKSLPRVPRDVTAAARRRTPELGEGTRLEQIFRSLATEAAGQPASLPEMALQRRRSSYKARLALFGLLVAVWGGFEVWQYLTAATLIVDWPLAEREGAVLIVGGRTIGLPDQQGRIVVSGRAGTWDLCLQRDGFEPIDETRTLGRGERLDFTPRWRESRAAVRRNELAILERRAAVARAADVLSPESAQVRAALATFVRMHAGSPDAAAATALLMGLRWPLDLVDGAAVSAEERDLWIGRAGHNPGAALVGVLGDGRLKFWNAVTAVAASHDSALLAGASLDGTVQVFDAISGSRLHTITPPVVPIDLKFSPTGELLAIAGAGGPVLVWNTSQGTLSATLPSTAAPIAFSPDGKLIAGRASRQEISLWDAETGALRRTLPGHATGDVQGLSFSHNGTLLISSGSDLSVVLWDVSSGQERRLFRNARFPQFSPDDAYLAAGTVAGDLVLWDMRTGGSQRTFDDGGYPLAFRDGGRMLVSKRSGRAILWNVETGDELRTLIDVPELAAVSSDGAWLAGGDANLGELQLWNLVAGTAARVVKTAGPLAAFAFLDNSAAVVTGSKAGVIQIWSPESGSERTPTPSPRGPADLSPDGRWLAVRAGDRIERVDVVSGRSAGTTASGISDLDALSFSPDGRLLAGFGGLGLFHTSLRLWDPDSARELPLAKTVSGTVRTIDFSPDSQWLAAAGDSRMVTVWNISRRGVQFDPDDFTDRVTALAFHPDGRRLAVACQDQSVVLWDLHAGVGTSFAHAGAMCRQLAFSGDGERLAAPAGERVVVWNVATGKVTAELTAGAGQPVSIAWHPAGDSLAAAGNTGCVWLWHSSSSGRFPDEIGRAIRVGPQHGIVHRVFWSPEGRHLITVNGNGTIDFLRPTP